MTYCLFVLLRDYRSVVFFFFFLNVKMLYDFLEFEASTMLVMTIRSKRRSSRMIIFSRYDRSDKVSLVHRALESSTLTIVKRGITCCTNARACPLSIEEKQHTRVINPIKVLLSLISINHPFTLSQFHVIHWNLFYQRSSQISIRVS